MINAADPCGTRPSTCGCGTLRDRNPVELRAEPLARSASRGCSDRFRAFDERNQAQVCDAGNAAMHSLLGNAEHPANGGPSRYGLTMRCAASRTRTRMAKRGRRSLAICEQADGTCGKRSDSVHVAIR